MFTDIPIQVLDALIAQEILPQYEGKSTRKQFEVLYHDGQEILLSWSQEQQKYTRINVPWEEWDCDLLSRENNTVQIDRPIPIPDGSAKCSYSLSNAMEALEDTTWDSYRLGLPPSMSLS